MDTALIIAGYAAAVSTANVAWQVYQWRERRQVRVEIRLSLFEAAADGCVEQRVGVRAVNRSERPVRWTAAELEPQDGSARRFFIARPPENAVIAAHDSLDTWAARAELEAAGLDLGRPVVAIVRLAAGEEFRSPTQVLERGQSYERASLIVTSNKPFSAWGEIFGDSRERTAALDGWLFTYNHHRRHSAIGRQPPITRLNNLLGSYTQATTELSAPPSWPRRLRVKSRDVV